jgi:hypothetical protein
MVCNFNKMHPQMHSYSDKAAYMWKQNFPLMQYCNTLYKKDAAALQFKIWAGMGPLYSSYGEYIIKKYPGHFLRYFVWPNFQKFFAPPLGYLRPYNTYQPTVPNLVVKWFGYTNNQVKTRTKNGQAWILEDYPFLISIVYLIMLLMFSSYLFLKGWQYSASFNKSIILAGFVWTGNAVFSIIASPIELRFQAFPVLLSATFLLLLIDWMAQLMQHLKHQSQQHQPDSEYAAVQH